MYLSFYPAVVGLTFGRDVDFAQLIEIYAARPGRSALQPSRLHRSAGTR